jgi:inositol-pentakisphosphate 2-kinase
MASVALYPVTSASYLNEGAANIVYRLDIRGPTPPATLLEEYGEGTPPPTEVEFEEFEEKQTQLKVFDSM